jgi:beta-galactosidase
MIRLSLLFLLTIHYMVNAQSPNDRVAFTIDDNWKFLPGGEAYAETVQADDAGWATISLPHTWNAKDPFDDDLTYRRGISWYRKRLVLDRRLQNKHVFLYFEGANQVTHVYVNGSFAGMHKGGYTGFAIDITDHLIWKGDSSSNTLAVQVSNAHDPFLPPLNVGYASYGGIYRDAWVIATDPLHFRDINNNAAGVFISTPHASKEGATIAVRTTISNDGKQERSFNFVNTITDAQGKTVQTISRALTIAAGQQKNISLTGEAIKTPHLWSPADPYLYQIRSELIENGTIIDKVENEFGVRWYSFNADSGFILNGKKLVLHGTNRHQDMKDKGDALSLDDHRRDMHLIKAMGCNFVRLAHYPQAAEVLRMADRLGLLIWEEVPVVNFITGDDQFIGNAKNMIHEMITQGYNHPSVIMWGSSNEILLHGPDGERIGRQTDTAYLSLVKKYATALDSTVRAEDPARYSTMAMHLSADYAKYGLDSISQVSGYNIYSGWYSGKVEDFSSDLDRRRKNGRIVFISEYGAEGETRLNTEKPVRMDYTTQYQRYYHESYLRQINQRPWLAGTAIWNEFDFSQPNIGGPAPHMNQKGLVTWDRKPKDAYYFYKANWNPEPMVYIATRDWLLRAGEVGASSTFDVYSNIPGITLSVNGISQKEKKVNDIKKASWQVQLKDGRNLITASGKMKGKVYTDQVIVEYRAYRPDLSQLTALAINAGAGAQYNDPSGTVWVEDRPWRKGSFGYLSGKQRSFDRKDVIKNTDDEPLFFSLLDSVQGYRFDVPDGRYAITLCFAEPDRLKKGDRIFDIRINDETVLRGLDLTAAYGFSVAMKKTFVADASKGNGITVWFDAKKGYPVLNGIKIEKQF